jgi:hypothetical protein
MKKIAAIAWVEHYKMYSFGNGIAVFLFSAIILVQIGLFVRLESGIERGLMVSAHELHKIASRFSYNIVLTVIPLIYIANLSREFKHGIVHRTLVSGITRSQYHLGKIIQSVYWSFAGSLLVLTFRLFTSLLYQIPFQFSRMECVRAITVCFFLCCLFSTFAYLTKKLNLTVLLFFTYSIVEGMMAMYLKNKGISVYFPFSSAVDFMRGDGKMEWIAFVMVLYTAVLMILQRRLIQTTDLF